MPQHGRSYEHDLNNGITEITPDEVWSTTVGYSGNAASDHADIVIAVDPKLATRHETSLYAIEAKKRSADSGKRCSNVFAGGKHFETGLEEVQRLVDKTPDWADPVVALKFDRRKLVVLNAKSLLGYLEGQNRYGMYDPELIQLLQPRLTGSDSVSMIKPELESWESARQADSDAVVLCERLGLPYGVDG
jgi:hypothetical protein